MSQDEKDLMLGRVMRQQREAFSDLNHSAVGLKQVGRALQQLGAALCEPNSVPSPLSAVPAKLEQLPAGLVAADRLMDLVRKHVELKHTLIEVQDELRSLQGT